MKLFNIKVNKRLIIINFIILIVILSVVEFLSFSEYKFRYKDLIDEQAKLAPSLEEGYKELLPKYERPHKYNYEKQMEYFDVYNRVYKGSKKGAIVTIGCSYTEGCSLKAKQTFAYKLNKYTGRTTYNRGIGGSGPQLVLRQLSDKNFKKEVPEADYVIYTFIYWHINRQRQDLTCYYKNDLDLNYYIDKQGNLKERKHPFWYMYYFFTTKVVAEYFYHKEIENKMDKLFDLFFKTMKESVKAMKINYPNAKFVLMEFPDAPLCKPDYHDGSRELTKEQIKKLEQLGIIYINAEELVGHKYRDVQKYRLEDKDHPNEQVWDEIVPALVKKLSL